MKSKTECRYWSEFYHYEQWLIDNDLLSSSKCFSLTHQIGDEYLIGLSRYVLSLKKRFKKNTVRVKVSRLIQCFRSAVSDSVLDLIRESVSLVGIMNRDYLRILTYQFINSHCILFDTTNESQIIIIVSASS